MTPEEKAQLEKDYPPINWPRMSLALSICAVIMIVASFVV